MLLFAGLRENPAEEELQPIALLSCKPDTATPPRVCSQSCSSLSKHCCWCLQVHPGTLCWQSRALHHLTASEAPVEPVEAVTPVDWQTNNTPAKLAGQLFYEELTMPVERQSERACRWWGTDNKLWSARRGTRSTWDQHTMTSWCHKEEWSSHAKTTTALCSRIKPSLQNLIRIKILSNTGGKNRWRSSSCCGSELSAITTGWSWRS